MITKKLEVGQTASQSMKIIEEMVKKYAEITGDYIPLHFNEEFTKKTKYGKLIAQDGVISGVLNTIVAMDTPGPGTVFIHQKYDYNAPVFIGDEITGFVEIYEVHPTKPVTKINVKIINQKKEVVLTGKAVCYTFNT